MSRKGNFTNSKIYKLVKNGRNSNFSSPGITYIKEKALEYLLGSSLDKNVYTQSIAWGNIMEVYLHSKLGLNYIHTTNRRTHKELDFWSGIPDFEIIGKAIAETKSYQPKKFAEYSLAIMKQDVNILKENFPDEYWQIVGNCEINDLNNGEAISFMPTIEDVQKLRYLIEETDFLEDHNFKPWDYRFIIEKDLEDLACMNENNSLIPSVNRFMFEVPKEDKEFLKERVILANEEKQKIIKKIF
jgi:hypothetical protein